MSAQVAIIIPAYHAHETIKSLLYSIAAQTKVDLCKVILVDDADNQAYDYLYESFPSLDMVILRNETNIGPGSTRNKGIEKAIALDIPYIMFADADDQFYNCLAVEMLLSTLLDNESDLVCGAFYEELDGALTIHQDFDIWLFGKIYKTQIIKEHNIRFPIIAINEDVCFNLHYWLSSNSKNQITEILYLWKNNPNSITRRDGNVYTWESYAPLCENLIITYNKIFEEESFSKEEIVISLVNRLVRLYCGYNRFLIDPNAEKYLPEMLKALQELNKKVYEPYWTSITKSSLQSAWIEIAAEGLTDYYPAISLESFIEKIRER